MIGYTGLHTGGEEDHFLQILPCQRGTESTFGLQADEIHARQRGTGCGGEIYSNTSGIRDLEQAAEHLAAMPCTDSK